jgi:hypothetical protein
MIHRQEGYQSYLRVLLRELRGKPEIGRHQRLLLATALFNFPPIKKDQGATEHAL